MRRYIPGAPRSQAERIGLTDLLAEDVRERLSYDPETGLFVWKDSRRPGWRGKRAGCKNSANYINIKFLGRSYQAHRLAWLITTGEWPVKDIDHENRDRSDNRWSNLREVDQSQNCANTPLYSNNSSNFKGVSFHIHRQKWQDNIQVNNNQKYLGIFNTPEQAYEVYLKAAKEAFGDFIQSELR